MVRGAGITEWPLIRGPIATENPLPCQTQVACLARIWARGRAPWPWHGHARCSGVSSTAPVTPKPDGSPQARPPARPPQDCSWSARPISCSTGVRKRKMCCCNPAKCLDWTPKSKQNCWRVRRRIRPGVPALHARMRVCVCVCVCVLNLLNVCACPLQALGLALCAAAEGWRPS